MTNLKPTKQLLFSASAYLI